LFPKKPILNILSALLLSFTIFPQFPLSPPRRVFFFFPFLRPPLFFSFIRAENTPLLKKPTAFLVVNKFRYFLFFNVLRMSSEVWLYSVLDSSLVFFVSFACHAPLLLVFYLPET